ncbi:hypothetical protein MBLNU457_1913t1 [Dothideomycetes sp. NU457]
MSEKPTVTETMLLQEHRSSSTIMSTTDSPLTQPSTRCDVQRASLTEPESITKVRLILVITSVLLSLFLSLLDTSIVSTSLYTIGTSLDALDRVTWVALAYMLSDVGLATFFAAFSDVIGRKNALTLALAIFIVFSIAAGICNDIASLVVCRAMQGVGGSGMYALAFLVLPDVLPLSQFQWIGAMAGGVVTVSGVLGPVLGGVITKSVGWRWIFWIPAPIAALSLVLFYLSSPHPTQLRPRAPRKFSELDTLGSILLTAFSVLLVFGLNEGSIAPSGFKSALFIGPLVASIVCLIALIIWQVAIAHDIAFIFSKTITPLFPTRVLRNRPYVAAVTCTLATGLPTLTLLFALPLRLQIVNGLNALTAGTALLPMLCASAMGSVIAGFVTSKSQVYYLLLSVGAALTTLGCALLTTLDVGTLVQGKMYGFEVLVGLGFGLTVACSTSMSIRITEPEDGAVATGIVAQARLLGGSIGIAAFSAVLGGLMGQGHHGASVGETAGLSREALDALRAAYADAFTETMKICAAFAGVAVLCGLASYKKDIKDFAIQKDLLEKEQSESVGAASS